MKQSIILAFCSILYLNAIAQADTSSISVDSILQPRDSTPIRFVQPAPIHVEPVPQKPRLFDCITHVPNNMWQMAKAPFKKKNLGNLALVAGATALILWKDRELMDHVHETAGRLHIDPTTKYNPVLRIKEVVLLKAPDNINSALIQLGDGGTSLLLAGGLFIHGKASNDPRAIQAASDVAETVITMAVTMKTVKWMAGRQEPLMSTSQRGSWKPFPSMKDFWGDKANYDAFASGHVATLTATVTVLGENYPEKKWIKPVGYSLVGMMAFALSNTKVHWVGDYPLAFALGYLSGKVTAGRDMVKKQKSKPSVRWVL